MAFNKPSEYALQIRSVPGRGIAIIEVLAATTEEFFIEELEMAIEELDDIDELTVLITLLACLATSRKVLPAWPPLSMKAARTMLIKHFTTLTILSRSTGVVGLC